MAWILRYLRDRWWKPVEGDLKWYILTQIRKRGPAVLTLLGAIATSGYLAARALIDSQPFYFVATLFLVVLTCVIGIVNGIREWLIWDKWKRQFFYESILHPSQRPQCDGVLWKWDGEGAAGPFCPDHAEELLFYKSGITTLTKDFDDRILGLVGHLFCPTDDKVFKFLEMPGPRVREFREQASARMQNRRDQIEPIITRIRNEAA